MVERVARKLCEHHIRVNRRWDTEPGALEAMLPNAVGFSWPNYVDDAKVAIEAMREPTPEMVEAGQKENNLLKEPDPPNAFEFLSADEMTAAWTAMIDAALTSHTDTPKEK